MTIAYFDCETTGINYRTDRIITLALVSEKGASVFRFNPELPIPKEASAVHGITDADCAEWPIFAERAGEVQRIINAATCLVGFNSKRFDSLILDAELRRCGYSGIDFERVSELDLLQLWYKAQPRTLSGAVRAFLGREHDGAHDALADAAVCRDLLPLMLSAFSLNFNEAVALSSEGTRFDRVRLVDGEWRFNFGKHRGQLLKDHAEYCKWMLAADFDDETKQIIGKVLDECRQ